MFFGCFIFFGSFFIFGEFFVVGNENLFYKLSMVVGVMGIEASDGREEVL